MITMTVSALAALTAIVFAVLAQGSAQQSGEYANNAAAFGRRRAEQDARVDDLDDVLEVDRGAVIPPGGIAPTIPIPIDLIRRAARRRMRETSPRRHEATVRPAQADPLHAPGRTSN